MKTYVHKSQYKMHSSFIHNSQKLETTQTSIPWLMDKLWYFHTMECFLPIQKKGLLNLMNIILRKKAGHKRVHTLWFDVYEILEQAKLTYDVRKQKTGCPGLGPGLLWQRLTRKTYKETFWVMEIYFTGALVPWGYTSRKIKNCTPKTCTIFCLYTSVKKS